MAARGVACMRAQHGACTIRWRARVQLSSACTGTGASRARPPMVDELPEQLEMLRAKKEEEEKVRKLREAELRKETKERLRKLENQSLDLLPQSKPKYENYLGQVKLKKREETESWQRIFEDKKLSKEEKYSEMLKKASAMESKAKLKEQLRQDGDEDAVNLYIGSIQAKLALLEKF